jgi:hypothetical protein
MPWARTITNQDARSEEDDDEDNEEEDEGNEEEDEGKQQESDNNNTYFYIKSFSCYTEDKYLLKRLLRNPDWGTEHVLGNWTWPPEQPTKQQESEGQENDSSEDEDDNDEEESNPQRPRLARELRALGITPTEAKSISTINETPREGYSAITSDPGVPTTFEEALFDQRAMFGGHQYMKKSWFLSAGKVSRNKTRSTW